MSAGLTFIAHDAPELYTIPTADSMPDSHPLDIQDTGVLRSDNYKQPFEYFTRNSPIQSEPEYLIVRHGTNVSFKTMFDNENTPTFPSTPYASQQPIERMSQPQQTSLALSMATTMHNLPSLYGDHRIRRMTEVTGLSSSMKQVGKSLGFGFYDGFTGLVTSPVKGAIESGPKGMAKGFMTGVLGVVVKPVAAGVSGAGYAAQGARLEMRRRALKAEARRTAATADGEGYGEYTRPSFEVHSMRKTSSTSSMTQTDAAVQINEGNMDGKSESFAPIHFSKARRPSTLYSATTLDAKSITDKGVMVSATEVEIQPSSIVVEKRLPGDGTGIGEAMETNKPETEQPPPAYVAIETESSIVPDSASTDEPLDYFSIRSHTSS